ncbi:hypothetical protein GGX14DRAFT_522703 [Mycena pura]|uniref:N-acetyltransferase domain-containing protein n=1 Tax=Mycena pura TaxID=153505 RepID=A0AAD6VEW0_9AGAR|nr:hypothetical protein GGX14DRAFT_522703 [Mycena pura]
MPRQYTYSTRALPSPRTAASQPADVDSLTRRYAALRLEALLTSPKAFASSYAIESAFTLAEWGAKIWRDDAVVLVCIADHTNPAQVDRPNARTAPTPGLGGEWVGSAILRGPLPVSEYALPHESGTPPCGSDADETRWQMTAVFASVAHRGRGLGKMLIQAGKDYARAQTPGGLRRVRLRVMIHPENLAVLGLYSAMNFIDVGRATGQEAYRTNGDFADWNLKLKSLTDDMKVEWQTARVAAVMECVEEV